MASYYIMTSGEKAEFDAWKVSYLPSHCDIRTNEYQGNNALLTTEMDNIGTMAADFAAHPTFGSLPTQTITEEDWETEWGE